MDVLRLFDWLAERWEVLPFMTVSPALLPVHHERQADDITRSASANSAAGGARLDRIERGWVLKLIAALPFCRW